MATENDVSRPDERNEINEQAAREEGARPEELREINGGHGDGGNPTWWRNEGGSGEVE